MNKMMDMTAGLNGLGEALEEGFKQALDLQGAPVVFPEHKARRLIGTFNVEIDDVAGKVILSSRLNKKGQAKITMTAERTQLIAVVAGPDMDRIDDGQWPYEERYGEFTKTRYLWDKDFAVLHKMREERIQGQPTGRMTGAGISRTTVYGFACRCGHRPVLTSENLFRDGQPLAVRCKACQSLVDMEPAILSENTGKTAYGDDDTATVAGRQSRTYQVPAYRRIRIEEVETGGRLSTGRMVLRPKLPQEFTTLMINAIENFRAGGETDDSDGVMPKLYSVYQDGTAPGIWEPETVFEHLLAGRWAEEGKAVRPYPPVKALNPAVCKYYWAMNSMSAGWLDVETLYRRAPRVSESRYLGVRQSESRKEPAEVLEV